MKLTDRQADSLDTRKNLVVTAGAGSGKTKVLVERYMSILRNEPELLPSSILALTFTEKASMEMKERIRKKVQQLSDELGGRWEDVLDDLDSTEISTIHSFCTGLVREDPLKLGIDPDVRVLAENECSRMLQDVIRETFTFDSPVSLPLRRLIVDYGQYNVRNMITGIIRSRSRLPHDPGTEDLEKGSLLFHNIISREIMERAIVDLEDLKVHLRALADIPVPKDRRDLGVKLISEIEPLLESVRKDAPYTEIMAAISRHRGVLLTARGRPRGARRLGNSRVWGADIKQLKESAGALFAFAGEYSDLLHFVEKEGLMERARERLRDLLAVSGHVHARYSQQKRKANGMDFDDQISFAMRLLESEDGRVLHRLRRRFGHVLIDEFQDTDPRQWRLAELLWDHGRGCTLFVVGDPKQSIYGFRSADVRLFLRASGILKEHDEGGVVVLDRNFRSSSEVMDFVNGIFPRILDEEEGDWSVPFDPLDAHRGSGGSVTVVGVIGKDGAEAREGRMGAEMIKRAMRGWEVQDENGTRPMEFSDIAVLLPTRKGFQNYEEALREASIPYQVYKGKGYFERQEIKDVLNLLDFLVDPNDDIALASLLKGPFVSLSDEELMSVSAGRGRTLFDKIRNNGTFSGVCSFLERSLEFSGRIVPSMALEKIFEESSVHATAGGRRQYLNLDKLLEWSTDPLNGSDMTELASSLRLMVEEPPKEGEPPMTPEDEAVTILTIHAAKGLEWPMVLVLGMNHEGRGDFGSYRIHPEHGVAMRVLDTTTGEQVSTPAWSLTGTRNEEKDLEERKRLFYVACTRARDHLVLSGMLPVDRRGVEREPRGLMRFMKQGMDLSLSSFDERSVEINGVDVRLVAVRPGEVSREEPEDECRERDFVPGEVPASIEPLEASGKRFVSPSALTGPSKGGGISGLNTSYPAPDEFGTMVHRVLQGVPVDRVLREYGCPEKRNELEREVRNIRDSIDMTDVVHVFREAEVVSERGDGTPLKGRCDLILKKKNGDLVVIDYKTGARKKEHLVQLEAYRDMLDGKTQVLIHTKALYSKDP